MSQKQKRSEETISAIMYAALHLGAQNEGREVTVREICAEAGVSVGAFYHHFSSREEVFKRSFEYFDLELSRRISLLEERASAKDALFELLMFQISFIAQEGPEFAAQYYRSMLDHTNSAAIDPHRTYYQVAYGCLHRLADDGLLRPECPPERTAELCISFVRGCLIAWSLHSPSYDIVAYMRDVLPIFMRGFLKE